MTELIFENEKGGANPCTNASNLQTNVEEWDWVNWATFIVEWQGSFNTGKATFELMHVTTGGRRDGKPIPALEPIS
ncbi:hypothetical protein K4F52_003816 [Lecanicillium sp. MT-2017a]|nr:hypothetical protein K4F52_003816 [Lecanicillium sp. MT-2017a]